MHKALQEALGTNYRLDRELEGGGMSRIIVARDETLQREVVIKVVRSDLVGSGIDRFRREIAIAARLQHPHIVPLLSTGEVGGVPFYIMPFVRGESLRARIAANPAGLPVAEVTRVIRDIASALAYAHGEGIVHRDIKPENVLITGGVAVVTDFGVAKAIDASLNEEERGLTTAGVALGTPAYMSPEQATADPAIDERTDLYSFGCVAYELLAGRPPIIGRNAQEVLAAHITRPAPPLPDSRQDVPAQLADLVLRCLEKDPARRPASAAAVVATLDALTTPQAATARPRVTRRRRLLLIAGALGVAAVTGVLWLPRGSPTPQVTGTQVIASAPGLEADPSISPDGKLVTYVAGPMASMRVYVRQIEGGAPPLAVAPSLQGNQWAPRWSPDGRHVRFVQRAGREQLGGVVYSVPYTGGTPRRLLAGDSTVISADWSQDGRRVAYTTGTALVVADSDGTNPRVLVRGAEIHSPALSPSGDRIAYVRGDVWRQQLFVGNGASAILTVATDGQHEPIAVTQDSMANFSPTWDVDGKALFFLSNAGGQVDAYRQRLGRSWRPTGPLARITTALGAAAFRVSARGDQAVYSVVDVRSSIAVADIDMPPDRTTRRPFGLESQYVEGLDLSPDGKWLTFESDRKGNSDIWKVSADGGEPVQLTSSSAPDFQPRFSGDGRQILYYSMRSGHRNIRLMDADGRNDRVVTDDKRQSGYGVLSPDGSRIAFMTAWTDSAGLWAVRLLPDGTWGDRRSIVKGHGMSPRWSSDGRWLVFISRDGVVITDTSYSASRVVARHDMFDAPPSFLAWDPIRSAIMVATQNGSSRSFWRLPLSGPPRLVARFTTEGPERQEFATDGRRVFMISRQLDADIRMISLKR